MATVAPFSSTAYAAVPSTPTRSRTHSTTVSMYSDKDSLSPPSTPPRRPSSFAALTSPRSSRRLPAIVVVGVLSVLAWTLVGRSGSSSHALLAPAGRLQYNARGKVAVDFEAHEVPEEWLCNPYKEPGKLVVDLDTPHNNIWKPYDETCETSQLMKGLLSELKAKNESRSSRHRGPLRSHDSSRPTSKGESEAPLYPWLVNATVLMQGDSMERLHLSDFCDFVGGDLVNISPNHTASPPTYRKQMPVVLGKDGKETQASIDNREFRVAVEDHWENRPNSWFFTRPWYCDIKEYNATLVSVFAWGMEDMEDAYAGEEFFHGPSTWVQRFHHVTMPLLHNLAKLLDRPQILHPTMIELSAGFWDLRAMTEQDFISRGIQRPYPMDSPIPFGNIGEEREKRWAGNAAEIIKLVAETFQGEKGVRDGPVITWRSLHHPKRNNYTPYTRAFALDQLARKVVHDLRVSSLSTHPTVYSSARQAVFDTKDRLFASNHGEKDAVKGPALDYGFDERLRVNEIGPLLLGQQDQFKDFLHPNAIPGSYLWSDIMLYELKRTVLRIGRS